MTKPVAHAIVECTYLQKKGKINAKIFTQKQIVFLCFRVFISHECIIRTNK